MDRDTRLRRPRHTTATLLFGCFCWIRDSISINQGHSISINQGQHQRQHHLGHHQHQGQLSVCVLGARFLPYCIGTHIEEKCFWFFFGVGAGLSSHISVGSASNQPASNQPLDQRWISVGAASEQRRISVGAASGQCSLCALLILVLRASCLVLGVRFVSYFRWVGGHRQGLCRT